MHKSIPQPRGCFLAARSTRSVSFAKPRRAVLFCSQDSRCVLFSMVGLSSHAIVFSFLFSLSLRTRRPFAEHSPRSVVVVLCVSFLSCRVTKWSDVMFGNTRPLRRLRSILWSKQRDRPPFTLPANPLSNFLSLFFFPFRRIFHLLRAASFLFVCFLRAFFRKVLRSFFVLHRDSLFLHYLFFFLSAASFSFRTPLVFLSKPSFTRKNRACLFSAAPLAFERSGGQ